MYNCITNTNVLSWFTNKDELGMDSVHRIWVMVIHPIQKESKDKGYIYMQINVYYSYIYIYIYIHIYSIHVYIYIYTFLVLGWWPSPRLVTSVDHGSFQSLWIDLGNPRFSPAIFAGYPLVMTNGSPWYSWPIEIDGLPIINGDFPWLY